MTEPNIKLYGAYWCPDCHRSKQFLGEHQIPYQWVDIEEDAEGERYVIEKTLRHPQVEVRFNSVVESFDGADSKLRTVNVMDTVTGIREGLSLPAAFVFIGLDPNTGMLRDSPVLLDRWGFIVTGHALVHAGTT
jgi:thioredoxin reductase